MATRQEDGRSTEIEARKLRRMARRLKDETRGEIRIDDTARSLYATDASLYEIPPVGVFLPRSADDVSKAVEIAADLGIAIIPRGAATSLSGQTIGSGLVIDFSKHMNRIGIVDKDRMCVRVEPGVVCDQLNRHLKPLGLMFGPDVSTSDRATLGGMIGNNSAGARSLKYGKTIDHVDSVEVVLSGGMPATFRGYDPEELETLIANGGRLGYIHKTVRDLVCEHRESIVERYPRILRRVSGYNLDEFVPGLPVRAPGWQDAPWKFNLTRLLVGSEGTLGVITGAVVKVVPIPACQGLVVVSHRTIRDALISLPAYLAAGPAAVEMIDRMILDLARAHPEYARLVTFADGDPQAVLAAQLYADSPEELAEKARIIERELAGNSSVLGVRQNLTASSADNFWKVRKAGLSLLMGLPGDAKPVAFVEDTAVAPEVLPAFYDRFMEIVARHGTEASCYGHADVGCLHIRPVLNMKTQRGVDQLREIAEEVSDLVSEFGGSMSGEHGDGLARSRWNRKIFGDELFDTFKKVKHCFDPADQMNPGKVAAEPELTEHLRISPQYSAMIPDVTGFDFADQGGLDRAVELCSGVGVCRKTDVGTMCPSYMVTRDEEHSTRGRANLLREVMSGRLGDRKWDHPGLAEAMDLCLGCKACKSECPSGVDMARLKSEFLYQTHRERGRPDLAALIFGNIHILNRWGSRFAPLANIVSNLKLTRRLLEKTVGLDRRRELPRFVGRKNFRRWFASRPQTVVPEASLGTVVFLDDCFTTYNHPEVGQAAVRLLEAAGYEVRIVGGACCGRPAVSKGLLEQGRDLAQNMLEKLETAALEGFPIVGAEPSCMTMLADDFLHLRLGPAARKVASNVTSVENLVLKSHALGRIAFESSMEHVLLHGHCQQKAIFGTAETVAALKLVPGLKIQELDSGCCGMAGSFGYDKDHYELSSALAERVLLQAAREKPDSTLLAVGTSCRAQVGDLAGIAAIHPIEFLARRLKPIHDPRS
jgi:FAD/FMN-containing dehydrogenase/Fe-S oxidoreductase